MLSECKSEELFEIFDESGNFLGLASRERCHGDPSLIHRTVHVVVFSSDGRILLQKRSETKDIQPGKWDTAVGGHMKPGESFEEAAKREMQEEIGIGGDIKLDFLFDLQIRNEIESEDTRVFSICSDGPFDFDRAEIDELRFWSTDEILSAMGKGIFTPNLEVELKRILKIS